MLSGLLSIHHDRGVKSYEYCGIILKVDDSTGYQDHL